ncbi:MAG: hypothetical protein K2M47_06665 [Clostridiales bacterium]|nr:hypothetical protein [Clostridiales bacterium]
MNNHTSENRIKIGRRVLLLLATVITALAVAVTCALTLDSSKKVSVDSADSAEVSTSANYTNLTGTTIQTYITNGTFTNGNYVDYTYNGGYYSVTFPRGTWKFELWGARGGYSGSTSANTGTANGGYGGYVAAQITLTAAKTYYIYCGGTGAGGTGSIDGGTTWRYGGYNGGGNGIGTAGSGGGGATDIRTTAGTATTASSYNTRVLVAAGGGGGNTTTYTQAHSANAIYQGGSADSSRHVSSYPNDEGGGGGGYYGGAVRHGDDPRSSYSGSNYVGSGFTQISNALGNSGASGNGRVRVTAVSINQAPVSQNYNYPTSKVRGTSVGISIAASTLAKDNDYANISGGNINNVYFTAGTSSNYDTAPANNAGLYLNSACTVNASSYMTYNWSGGTATTRNTLNITAITKLPRAGVDGQADGKFTLYTKVRDAFGSTTSRGVGVAMFTIPVTNQNLTVKGASNVNGKYKFGTSNYQTAAEKNANNFVSSYSDGKIYNPYGKNLTTIFIPKPISPTDTAGITLSASEFYSDADTAYDKVAFKSTAVVGSYVVNSNNTLSSVNASAYYTASLTADTTYATGLYSTLTIKPTGTRPSGAPFVVLQITAQSSETASKAAVGNTVNTVYVVFQISNTRPYFGSTNALATKLAEPLVTVAPGATAQISLKSFLYDMDDGGTITTGSANGLRATFAQGTNDLKVPTNEYIQVDTSNIAVPLATNVGSNYAGKTSVASNSATTGEGTTPTYFNTASIAANGSNAASTANVTYRYVNSQTIEFTGRSATQNQYRDSSGNRVTRKGHFYILVRVVDPSDTADTGIWFPIAIEVTSQTPTEPATFANVSLGFTNVSATNGGDGQTAYFTPISYVDTAGTLQGIGKTTQDLDNVGHAIPFALDRDGFMYAAATGETFERARGLNDFVFINGGDSAILDNGDTETGTFFSVRTVKLYAARSVFKMIPDSALSTYGITKESNTLCSFNGLAVTAKRSTNGEYYQFRVNVKDTHDKAATISICVKVENRAVSARLDPDDGTHKINALTANKELGKTPYGEYAQNANLGGKVVNYTIEVMDEVQITPYDFAYDFDIDPSSDKINASGTFNSNPMDAGFGTLASTHILKTYSVAHTSAPATTASQKTKSAVSAQKLDFANRAAITAYDAQYSNYINVSVSDYSIVKNANGTTTSYAIPAIKITGVSRTTSAIVQLHFTITDGTETINCMFTVTVLNAAPTLNPDLNDYYNLSAYPDASSTSITPNVREFTTEEISSDKDGDIPTFDSESVRIVAKDGNNYYTHLYYENGSYHGCDADNSNASVNLSEYVSAVITKGSGTKAGADVIRLTGLSSTELFNLPIYVEFLMRDGYRAQPQEATLHLLINVVNTAPIFVGDSLLKTEATAQTQEKYQWLIGYEVSSEILQPRYLFNSKELYEGSLISNTNSPISIPENNKVYLFDDYDAKQRVILNPSEFSGRSDLVSKYENRVFNGDGSVASYKDITADDFTQEAYKNAAVLYTPMYVNSAGDDAYVNVTIRFFYKDGNEFKEYATTADIRDCEYWAIEITDTHEQGTRREIQFALSVKDSHHGKLLYTAPDKAQLSTVAHTSDRKLLNFYYNYRQPGILAMHTYYRTDGNAESKILVKESDGTKPAQYLVDQSVVTSADFDESETTAIAQYNAASSLTISGAQTRQEILGHVKFKDEFKYRYFERTYEQVVNGVTSTYLTSKRYQQSTNKFSYAPIEIQYSSTNDAVRVPMSFIALPKGVGSNTENGTHVTFANAGAGNTLSGGNELLDKDYASWGNSNANLALIYKNMTLSDGVNTYPVTDNPYITVKYVAGPSVNFASKYVNNQRFKLTNADGGAAPFEDINYREDKYGFEINKKAGGKRAPGLLKLTIALKTIDIETESAVEMVDVEIKLFDYEPLVKYYNFNENKADDGSNNYVSQRVVMTIGNTGDASDNTNNYVSTMTLVNKYNEAGTLADAGTGDKGVIYYNDPDKEDTMKFYLPSTVQGGLTRAEVDHLLGTEGDAIRNYYGVATDDKVTDQEGEGNVNPYTYNPNPDYSMFFDVSPASGSSESLQFIPKAKTTPNFAAVTANMSDAEKTAYYNKYHLVRDANGGVYYPFRVLFYDEYKGSAFTEGYCYAAIIRVYIQNDETKVNTDAVTGTFRYNGSASLPDGYKNTNVPKYTVNLSTSSTYYVDVTSLLKDDDIVLAGTSYATVLDNAWTSLDTEEKYIRDYLVMPAADSYVDLTRLMYSSTNADLPFDIFVGGTGSYIALPHTTLIFKAKCAFKDTRELGYTFMDSNNSAVRIVFSCEYNNDAPTANTDTFGATNAIDVSMKTGETFYLYASDSTQFSKDAQSGFTSYTEVGTRYKFPYSSETTLTELTAKEMSDSFMFFTSRYGTESYTGNSLVLGSDDAPTTLRIVKVDVPNDVNGRVTVTRELSVNTEDYGNGRQQGHLRLAVSASGVVSTVIRVTLQDGKGATVEVAVRVNVISSAPTAKTTGLPAGVTRETDNTYAIALSYGESKSIYLGGNSGLMTDIDSGDAAALDVYSDMGGSKFSIQNPGENAVVTAAVTQDANKNNQITITATDFINKQGEQRATVSFRVKDAHGAVSDTVYIKVKILPAEVTTVVAASSSLPVSIMSYAEYIDAEVNKGEPQEIAIVENNGAKLFKDTDVTAPSAAYNVEVYVLLRQSESGAMNTVMYNANGSNILLYSRSGSSESFNNSDEEARYVQKYFDVTASADGKSLLFTPTAATVRSGTSISSIPLYVVVKKRYDDGVSTMAGKGSQIDVSVANSKLMATTSSSLNAGYPMEQGSQDLRDSDFLSFTGSKGDSLTWDLYNLENMYHGLYYDYDMINLSKEDGGKEIIKYIDYSYSVPNETGNTSNDPVLSIGCNGEGDNQKLTIRINRNVTTGQPPANGLENKPTQIEVSIYAVDAVNNVAGVTKNDRNRVTVTKIMVYVCNDRPEIAQTGIVSRCPYCGKSDNVRQTNERTAHCGDCNKDFKSLDSERLGYTLTHDDESGYVMNITLAKDKACSVLLSDIIDDADIDMDAYVMLNTGSENSLMSRDGSTLSTIRAGDESAFRVTYQSATNHYKVSTLSYITFTCTSTSRGAVAVCNVMFRDSYIGSATSVLTIRLTVGNIAPTVKPGAKTELTVMGVGAAATDEQVAAAYVEFNILDFITDANGDNFDPASANNANRSPTYTYVDDIIVYTSDDDSAANRPDMYGPNLMGESTNEETGETEMVITVDTACMVNWVEGDAAHQKFRIEPLRGIYGVQKVTLRIWDKGYEDGLMADILDGEELRLTLFITIANPLDDVDEILEEKDMVYGVTRTVLAKDLLGEDNAKGYEISDIKEVGGNNYLTIVSPDEDPSGNWRIYAKTESVNTQVTVTFSTGELTRERILPINVVANHKPQLKNDTSSYRYTVSQLDDKEKRTIKIRPTDWFVDYDAEDVMTFITPVKSSQSVKVEAVRSVDPIEEGGQSYIMLKFNRRGESVITVTLVDLSGRSYTYDITVECTDAPELSWWEDTMSLIEANWMWFWIIVGGALLFIILLIVIIVVVHKKRKMRREIEALLESETELEQEMMRLSSGVQYQSFGYLPPTQQGMVNPGMMLGGGSTAPQPNSLQLNAGTGTPPPQQPTINNIPGSAPNARPQTPPSNDGFDPDNF